MILLVQRQIQPMKTLKKLFLPVKKPILPMKISFFSSTNIFSSSFLKLKSFHWLNLSLNKNVFVKYGFLTGKICFFFKDKNETQLN